MAEKITKRVVDGISPGPTNVVVWDTEVKGFGIVCTPKGVKSYVLQYSVGTGRGAPKRRFTIGRHGSPWTAEKARSEAIRLAGLIEGGLDPMAGRQADRAALTISDLADLYLAEGVSHKKASTLKADRGRIEHHLKPLVGKKRVDQITRADVERMMIDVIKGKTAAPIPKENERRRGTLATGGAGVAAQCVTLLGTLLAFAVQREMRADNPAHGIKKPPVRKLERFLSEVEMARLAIALSTEADASSNPYPAAALRLLLLTGCRRGEIMTLRWEHVSLEHNCLFLPDSKTGKKSIYLSAPARAILAELPKMAGNPHVFPGALVPKESDTDSEQPAEEGRPYAGIDSVWARVRTAAELPGVRIHDLRHSFASIGASGGLGLPLIGALLGHKHAATTARYAHLSADPLRAANEAIGRKIENAMAPSPDAPSAGTIARLPATRRSTGGRL